MFWDREERVSVSRCRIVSTHISPKSEQEQYVSSQDHVMHKIYDLSHCSVRAALRFRRLRKLNRRAIAEQASR